MAHMRNTVTERCMTGGGQTAPWLRTTALGDRSRMSLPSGLGEGCAKPHRFLGEACSEAEEGEKVHLWGFPRGCMAGPKLF